MIKRTLLLSNPAYLRLKLGQIVITIPASEGKEERTVTRPIEDLGLVIIESHSVTLTSALLSELLAHNVAVITCDDHHMPQGLMLNLDGNTLQTERFLAQINSSVPLRKQLWQQTVKQKIANQAAVLKFASGAETGCLEEWSKAVRSGDPDNFEGRAAAYYWRRLFEESSNFRRGRFEEEPNHLLNYGYAILRGIVARALVGSGLLPTLGIHHCNRYNSYCLADDIMEPYRPYVDMMVVEIGKNFGLDTPLNREVKAILLGLPVVDVTIDGLRRPLMVAASMTSASLARCFLGEQKKISYPQLKVTT
ncbi:MAG: type II CRISPR-associated endonuclease Cas1 [Bacteroidales bacterium]|nr:type II CRISPR-associated endonuclease Cas1 [Bacteroidales bacterium]